jgi:hypothetical protein
MNPDDREQRRKRLLEEITEEERLVRIYEADYKVTKSRKRARGAAAVVLVDDAMQTDEDDWLTALDALQSHDTTGRSAKLDTRWHDDPLLYRILPHVGGIAFKSAKPGATRKDGAARYRCYEFEGSVGFTEDGPSMMTSVDFCIAMEVEFGEAAQVSKVDVILPSSDGTQEELQAIIQVVKGTRNLPLFFRQLLKWAKFDHRRKQFLARVTKDARIESVSPTLVRIRWSGDDAVVDIRWQWEVSWATSGKEVLEISNCRVKQGQRKHSAAAISQSKGLQQLLESVGGSCEEALKMLLQVANPPRE